MGTPKPGVGGVDEWLRQMWQAWREKHTIVDSGSGPSTRDSMMEPEGDVDAARKTRRPD